ncbi:hypothetical protein C8A00DRAFT_19588 [Chaetomidium leptoderma]|uniref:CNH domain-containing protein n=1 Tax=Chaetomidium leptoderma TaxID=669021 RepID=A0AAN6VBX6_9PEZI|nr:hypothetical protein C8A00DRAFT_19588 [Chaetomidium leptoderma]
MASDPQRTQGRAAAAAAAVAVAALPGAPYALRPLLHDVPLSADGSTEDVKINCVDYYDGNLYVGTSASELLHFFRIPPDPNDPASTDAFILATRLSPAEPSGVINGSRPGVQQILLLPRVAKACVLCNWTVTFYSLPELSPVFGGTPVKNCSWIGGVDLNDGRDDRGNDRSPGVTILLSLNRRIQVVRIGDEDARVLRKIDFAGSTLSVRRDSIACVADPRSYSLLDVDRQLKIPLMSISSLDHSQPDGTFGQAQNVASAPDSGLSRSASSATARAPANPQGHSRSTSLGGFISGIRRNDRRGGEAEDSVFQDSDAPPPSRSPAPADKPLPAPPRDSGGFLAAPPPRTATPPVRTTTPSPNPASVFLKPHIVSPTAEEFLIVTGTGPLDPGIGMFVNLDGDPTRPTLEFERYPREIAVDGGSADLSSSLPSLGAREEGYVLASMIKEFDDGLHHGLEIQRFDVNMGENEPQKWWLEVKDDGSKEPVPSTPIGIRSLLQSEEMLFEDVVGRLCQRRFSPFKGQPETPTMSLKSSDSRTALSLQRLSQEKALFDRDPESDDEQLPPGWEAKRNQEGEDFVRRLAKTSSRLAVWAGDNIWWAVRNPLLSQLDSALEMAAAGQNQQSNNPTSLETRRQLLSLLHMIEDREATTELEFMTLGYIKQKTSVMLLTAFLSSPEPPFTDTETLAMEENLVGGDLDARVVLSLIPALRNEIVVNRRGIWIYGGIKNMVESYISSETDGLVIQGVSSLAPNVLQFLRRFLSAWRKKKGFGSIPDEVFRTVDASLLLVLLELDQSTPVGQPGKLGSVRKELYELVDHGVDCFDRAVDLLETYRRLFVLSRLYQNRKMVADVLGTWRRIIDGEEDRGGELGDGEQRVRSYLSNISNQALVQEYGLWLASRDPKLGVQVFTDEKGKAPKFEHTQIVALLREEAPDAVKYYLEHLVFGKGNTAYVNELITYYLDIVITDLETSPASRDNIAASYDTYRALHPPKPTYLRFLADNAPPNDEVWQSRLRLLQLLGGGHDYDAAAIRRRIDDTLSALPSSPSGPVNGVTSINGLATTTTTTTTTPSSQNKSLLVPESIILASRARHHTTALRLLVHRLGDHDTAVSYCIRGGAAALTPAGTTAMTSTGARHHRRDSDSDSDDLPPTWDEQTRLFRALLEEFLVLRDEDERVEQTGALLERFGGWFDVVEVLALVPEGWAVEVVGGFFVAALRRMVGERREAMVERALSGAENLRVGFEFVVKVEGMGGVVWWKLRYLPTLFTCHLLSTVPTSRSME